VFLVLETSVFYNVQVVAPGGVAHENKSGQELAQEIETDSEGSRS